MADKATEYIPEVKPSQEPPDTSIEETQKVETPVSDESITTTQE